MRKYPRGARCLPVIEWPVQDQAAWATANAPYDPFDSSVGLASAWSTSTRQLNASGYGRWLGWLQRCDFLDHAISPGRRVTHERMTAYLESMRIEKLADYSVAGRIKQVGRVLQMLEPEMNWVWIIQAADRLHSKAEPSRDRRPVMRPPEEILTLGLDLMEAAEADRFRTSCDRATLYRDGLLLAFLVQRPFRRANLANLTIGKDLERRETWQIRINDDETKAGRPIFCPWPEGLVAPLEQYLRRHREVLLSGSKRRADIAALWVSRQGGAMTADAISYQIKSRTREEFGKAINPHTFRKVAATALATYTPADSGAIMDVLSHASMAMSEKFYNRADLLSAGERFHHSLATHTDRS